MRFLRPDLLRWWLVIPVIVASWAIDWRVMREWRLRSPVAARFAPLSRRSSGRRQVARLLASVATAGALVFALMRPQILLVRRVPDYERQDLIVLLDRSVSMRARDVAPSRFARATLELRNFLRQKPDGIGRVGLVGFADSSVVLSYLTGDVENILFYLDWLDGPSASASAMFGTNIGAALRSALDVARKDDRPTRKRFRGSSLTNEGSPQSESASPWNDSSPPSRRGRPLSRTPDGLSRCRKALYKGSDLQQRSFFSELRLGGRRWSRQKLRVPGRNAGGCGR